MNKALKYAGSLFLIIVLLHYFVGTSCFFHTHEFQAHVITHSHPYKTQQDNKPKHTHTAHELELISILDQSLSETINVMTPVKPVLILLNTFPVFSLLMILCGKPGKTSNRSPPALPIAG